jgi:putative flippase GtrA
VLQLDYLIATALAVEAAVLHNFFWHQRFTWADRGVISRREVLFRLLRFNLTNGASSILGNLLAMRLLVGEAHLPYLPANIISIAACSLVNFALSDRVVFRAAAVKPGPISATADGLRCRAHQGDSPA